MNLVADVSKYFGSKRLEKRKINNEFDLLELSSIGITKSELLYLAEQLSLSSSQVAALLPITERTLQRYDNKKRFNKFISEQIIKIALVYAKGINAFESKEKFLTWLNLPNKALSNRSPLSLLDSSFGINLILNELGRIEHGVFS